MLKIILSKKGFTISELIVVMFIVVLFSSVGVIGYNAVTKNMDLGSAKNLILDIINMERMAVVNGNNNCSRFFSEYERHYIWATDFNEENCYENPILSGTAPLILEEKNNLKMNFKNHAYPFRVEKKDEQGKVEFFTVSKNENFFKTSVGESKEYAFYITPEESSLDEETVAKNTVKIKFYYLADDNYKREEENKIIVEEISGKNADNLTMTGSVLKLSFRYPVGKAEIKIGNRLVRYAEVFLNKKNAASEENKVYISDIFDALKGSDDNRMRIACRGFEPTDKTGIIFIDCL